MKTEQQSKQDGKGKRKHRPPSLRPCNLATACCQIGPSLGTATPEKPYTPDLMAMTGLFKDLDVSRRKMPAHWSTRHA